MTNPTIAVIEHLRKFDLDGYVLRVDDPCPHDETQL